MARSARKDAHNVACEKVTMRCTWAEGEWDNGIIYVGGR